MDNFLVCGYIREYELKHKKKIPSEIQTILQIYAVYYLVYGIGRNSYGVLGLDSEKVYKYEPLPHCNECILNANSIYKHG